MKTMLTTLLSLFFITFGITQTIEVTPDSIAVTIASGDSLEVPITISNTGSADLEWNFGGEEISVEFTNCGQTGRFGPTQAMCDEAYTGTELEGKVTIPNDAGIQEWTVPQSGIYTIEGYGAEGGSYSIYGGDGAIMSGELNLIKEDILKILVGQKGSNYNNSSGGGGGGSFVVKNDQPIIVAGGGGGGHGSQYGYGGTIDDCGTSTNSGFGGCTGNGGSSNYYSGAAGGGYYTNGQNGTYYGYGGQSFLNGGNGGASYNNYNPKPEGGFGGGGGTHGNSGGGGGGGGWSGGGGSDHMGGNSAGSFIIEDAELIFAESGANEGHGKVIITYVGLPNYIIATQDTTITYANETDETVIQFNTANMQAGSYLNDILIFSNDTLNPSISIPVNLTVTGTPEMVLPQNEVTFDSLYIGFSDIQNFTVQNTGSDTLVVNLSTNNEDFTLSDTLLQIPAWSEINLSSTFSPTVAGEHTAEITLESNAGTQTITLNAYAMNPPILTMMPDSVFALDLLVGQSMDTSIQVCNDGLDENLTFSLTVNSPENYAYSEDFENGLGDWVGGTIDTNACGSASILHNDPGDYQNGNPNILMLTESQRIYQGYFNVAFNYHKIDAPFIGGGADVNMYLFVNGNEPILITTLGNDVFNCTDYNYNLSEYVNIHDEVKIGFWSALGGFYIDDVEFIGAGTTFLHAVSDGEILPGECNEVPVELDIPTDYVGGDYTVNLNINHSDPILQNPYTYPVQLHLTGVAIPQVLADSINFGWTYTNFEASPQSGFDLNLINDEDFDDNYYNDFWNGYNGGNLNTQTNETYYNSPIRSLYMRGYNNDTYLYSNSFITNEQLELSFWYYLYMAENDCNFKVQLNVNNGGYNTVWTSQNGDYNNSYLNIEEEVFLNLSEYVQNGDVVQIRFLADVYSGSSAYDDIRVYLDDIEVYSGSGIRISNLGTDVLDVSASVDNELFTISQSSLTLPAFSDDFISLSFLPVESGNYEGNITINTNTEDEFNISLTGYAVDPPVVEIDNNNLFFSLDSGEVECQEISISNNVVSDTSLSNLDLNITANNFMNQLQLSPNVASISSGEASTIEICFNATDIISGDYFGSVSVNSNDPYNPIENIGIQVHINGTPDINLLSLNESDTPFHEEYFSNSSWTSFWNESGSGGDAYHNSSYYVSPSYSLRMYGDNYDRMITSDPFSLFGRLKVEFYYKIVSSESNCNLQLQFSNDNGVTFESIWESEFNSTNDWELIELDYIDDLFTTDNAKVRFIANVGSPNSNEDWIDIYIDDIKLYNGELYDIVESVDFGNEYTYESNMMSLLIENPGTDTLRINDISSDSENMTFSSSQLNIPMNNSEMIIMEYIPTIVGLDSSIVTVATDFGDYSFMAFITGLAHAQMVFDPIDVNQTVIAGDTAHITVTIHNPGDDTLIFEVGEPTDDMVLNFYDDFENGMDKWNYTGSYPMQLSNEGDGYNSNYSLQAGGQYNATHYQEFKDFQEVTDRDNAIIELYAKSDGNYRWIDWQIDFGQGWHGSWSLIYINSTNWTHYSYDYSWILDSYNIQNGDQIKIRLLLYGWSYSNNNIDDIIFHGLDGKFDDFIIDDGYLSVLAPGESTELSFHIATTTMSGGEEFIGGLAFTTNDPANPDVELPITIFVDGPSIATSTDEINFEDVVLADDQHQNFIITNDGSQDLTISNVLLNNTWIEISSIDELPIVLSPGDSSEVELRYSAYDLNTHSAELSIYSDDLGKPNYKVDIYISGTWNNFEIGLEEGWNLLGPVMDFPVSTVIDSFETVIPYSWYGWENGAYHFADTLYAGVGYWVASLNNENIYVPNLHNVQPTLPRLLDDDERLAHLNKINISNEEYSQILYFGEFESEDIPKESFNLPPILPEIRFDIRYENQSRLFSENESVIKLISEDYPVTLNWNLNEKADFDEKRYLYVDGHKIDMDIQNELVLASQPNEIILVNKVIPNEYVLYQNYPNPFNPETSIKYGLAEKSEVKLLIFDVNGRLVRDLVTASQESGYHQIMWDGRSNNGSVLPSGIYFIRLMANNDAGINIIKTQKSLLLK